MQQPFENFYLRQDVAQLNLQLQSSDHNVKAYKRSHMTSKSRRKSQYLNIRQLLNSTNSKQANNIKLNNNKDNNQQKRSLFRQNADKKPQSQNTTRHHSVHKSLLQQNSAYQTQRDHFLNSQAKHDMPYFKSSDKTTLQKTNFNDSNRLSHTQGMGRRDYQQLSVNKVFTKQRMSTLVNQSQLNKQRQNYSTSKENQNKITFSKDQQQCQNKYAQLQKTYNKWPLKAKYVENWLNNILLQYCSQQKFDMTLQNPALKKYSIDENSLLAQSLHINTIHRIYKSLFVYSIGFNNLLKELTGKNVNMMKTIWKIYAILLQYCAQGNFESMVAEIQRDKNEKVNALKNQIQKRQKMIDEMDMIYKQKNSKIFKQIRTLKQQNINLISQKQVLQQELYKTQKALTDQVSLRLKFQNKINQIHGVHKDLQQKHAALRQKYKSICQEKKIKETQYNTIKGKIAELNYQFEQSCKTIKNLQKQQYEKDLIIKSLQQEKSGLKKEVIVHKSYQQELKSTIGEKDRKNCQLKTQLNSAQMTIQFKEQSGNQTSMQYQKSLSDNKTLQATIYDQMKQISVLLIQKKNTKQGNLQLQAQLHLEKQKSQNRLQQINNLKKQIKNLNQKIYNDQIQVQTTKKMCQSFESDLKVCYESIKQMKNCKAILQDELIFVKKQKLVFDDLLKEKQIQIQQLRKQIEQLEAKNQDLSVIIKQLESKLNLIQKKMKADSDMSKKKIDQLQAQRDDLQRRQAQKSILLQEVKLQAQKLHQNYRNIYQQVKNERFERVNLDLRYKQSLQVIQTQSGHITELNRNISQIVNQSQTATRNAKTAQYLLSQKTKAFNNQKIKMTQQIQQLKSQLHISKTFVHPMIQQDLRGTIMKFQLKIKEYRMQILKLKKQIKQTAQEKQKIKKELNDKIQQLTVQHEQKMNKKIKQIQYLQQKGKHLQQTVQKLQALPQNQSKSIIQLNSQKQAKYLNSIKQKSKQIDTLIKQLDKLQDHNSKMKKDMTDLQQNMHKKIAQSQAVINQVQKLRKQKIVIQKQKKQLIEQKQKLIKQHQKQIDQLVAQDYCKVPKNHKKQSQYHEYPILDLKQQYSSKKSNMQKSEQRNPSAQGVKRKDFTRKLKGAVMYYNK